MIEDNLDDLINFNSGYVGDNDILDVLSEEQEWYGKWVEATQKELEEGSGAEFTFVNEVLNGLSSEYRVTNMELVNEVVFWYFESYLE